jgi:hypothetical protein
MNSNFSSVEIPHIEAVSSSVRNKLNVARRVFEQQRWLGRAAAPLVWFSRSHDSAMTWNAETVIEFIHGISLSPGQSQKLDALALQLTQFRIDHPLRRVHVVIEGSIQSPQERHLGSERAHLVASELALRTVNTYGFVVREAEQYALSRQVTVRILA